MASVQRADTFPSPLSTPPSHTRRLHHHLHSSNLVLPRVPSRHLPSLHASHPTVPSSPFLFPTRQARRCNEARLHHLRRFPSRRCAKSPIPSLWTTHIRRSQSSASLYPLAALPRGMRRPPPSHHSIPFLCRLTAALILRLLARCQTS